MDEGGVKMVILNIAGLAQSTTDAFRRKQPLLPF
jgi:hypothetical protein